MLGKSIFVLEDDHDIRETVSLVLETEGFTVKSATSGAEAMRMLDDLLDSCLVLLDVMMPEMDGFEFLKTARNQSPALSRVPVVAMTASKTEEMPAGVVGLIRKPFELDQLLNVVHQHCAAN